MSTISCTTWLAGSLLLLITFNSTRCLGQTLPTKADSNQVTVSSRLPTNPSPKEPKKSKEEPHRSAPVAFTLTEHDDDGHTIALAGCQAIDLNSSLELSLDQAGLAMLLQQQGLTTTSENLTEQLKQLNDLVAKEQEVLASLLQAQQEYKTVLATPPADTAAYRLALKKWQATRNRTHPAGDLLANYPEILDRYEEGPTVIGWQNEYGRVFSVSREYISQQRALLDSAVRREGVYVQVGMWLLRQGATAPTPLHIPPFDDYPEQERFVVERWQYVLTDEQKAQLAQLDETAKTASKEGIAAMLKAQVSLKEAITQAQKQLDTPITSLLTDLSTFDNELKAHSAVVRDSLLIFKDKLLSARQTVRQLASKYTTEQQNITSTTLLIQTNADVQQLVMLAKQLKGESTRLLLTIDSERTRLKQGAAFAALTNILAKVKAVHTQLTHLSSVGEAGNLLQALFQSQGIATSALQFTEKVRKLSVAALPSTAEFDLANAGKRDQGDELVVKVAAGGTEQARREIQVQRLKLLHLIPFVRLAPALLFVDPLMHEEGDKAMFRVGASYSILYKGFWGNAANRRNHPGRFRHGGPGLGINIATLDFNGNGAPEIGIGLVGSVLADFLQAGLGLNTVSGIPYYFFSLRLPTEVFSATSSNTK